VVDEGNAEGLGDKGNDGVDGLVLEGLFRVDTCLAIYCDRVVLDSRDASHLNGSLKTASNQETAEARNVAEISK
jgi:hypothetical protein